MSEILNTQIENNTQERMKFDIPREDCKCSGIYFIVNSLDDRFYIGQAQQFRGRYYGHRHCLKYGKATPKLQRFSDKYGEDKLTFYIVEFVDIENLSNREQWYLDLYFKGGRLFNSSPLVQEPGRGCKHSAEAVERSASAIRGRKHSEEQKIANSKAHKGIKQRPEIVQKRAKSCSRPVLQYTKEGIFIREYESARIAKTVLGKDIHISSACKGKRKTAGGYIWRRKNV
jgi:group I intron endonuclease